MNKITPIIAIAGNARSGKDTLGSHWIEVLQENGIKAKRFAFADELKKSVYDFLMRETGISSWTEDPEEKKLIRPFLVLWGTEIMRKINDSVWVERLEESLLSDGVNVITDLRFVNELEWTKKLNGYTFMIHRDGVQPANPTEAQHNSELTKLISDQVTLGEIESPELFKTVATTLLHKTVPTNKLKEWKAIYPL